MLSHPERRKPRGIGRAGDRAERRRTRACPDADRGETDLHARVARAAVARRNTPLRGTVALVCRMRYAPRHGLPTTRDRPRSPAWRTRPRRTTTSSPGTRWASCRAAGSGPPAPGAARRRYRRLRRRPADPLPADGDACAPGRARRGVRRVRAGARHRRHAGQAEPLRARGRDRGAVRVRGEPWIVKHHGYSRATTSSTTSASTGTCATLPRAAALAGLRGLLRRLRQNSFDPAYETLPLESFEPMVRRVFASAEALDLHGGRSLGFVGRREPLGTWAVAEAE